MEKVKVYLKSNLLVIIGLIIGAIGGFVYWKLHGCTTGTCLITGNPYLSTLYGALFGGVLFSLFKKQKK